jgi:uncharacterized protein YlzI (FlbEa/FlbD family)
MNGLVQGVRITITMALGVVLFVASSYVGLAQVPFTGELLVSGNAVTVNGEAAINGRTLVAPSNIVTGAGSYATLNFTNIGRIQLSPGTTFTIDGSGTTLRGSLSSGSVTIVNAVNPVTITLMCGKNVIAKTGDMVSYDAVCGGGTIPPKTLPSGAAKNNSLLYLLLAGAAVGVIVGVAGGGGGNSGGGTTSGTT